MVFSAFEGAFTTQGLFTGSNASAMAEVCAVAQVMIRTLFAS